MKTMYMVVLYRDQNDTGSILGEFEEQATAIIEFEKWERIYSRAGEVLALVLTIQREGRRPRADRVLLLVQATPRIVSGELRRHCSVRMFAPQKGGNCRRMT